MKSKRLIHMLLLAAAFAFASALALPALAQTTAAPAAAASGSDFTAALTGFLGTFSTQHPIVLTILSIVGVLRLVFKPVMLAVEEYVKNTASTTDDAALQKVEASTAYRIFAWLLDYVGSIKVGPQRVPSASIAPVTDPEPTPKQE